MSRSHRSTLTPSKDALIAAWVQTQPWGPPAGVALTTIGSFRVDDPDGRVGMETFLVASGNELFQVPHLPGCARRRSR
jgi:hypothetical protein